MNGSPGNSRTKAKRLREEAAHTRRLAMQVPGDPIEKRLQELAEQLDAEAIRLEGEPPEAAGD